jgi:nucleoside triphosphate diphosphatase
MIICLGEVGCMTNIQHLLDIMAKLRDPNGGCPWDVKQNFATVAPYTIEEAYEVADAIDRNDMTDLKDELGDLLLQVVFHARMAEEAGHFNFSDVVESICDKMTRRHPHVFDAHGCANVAGGRMPGATHGATVEDADEQTRLWEIQKKREREEKLGVADNSVLSGVSRGMPEWQRAVKLQKRAASVGFDWPDPNPVFDKLHEEIEEVRAEFSKGVGHSALEDEIGDVLFVCANLTRHAKVDFGNAMRRANQKFERRFRYMESVVKQQGAGLNDLDLQQQDALWDQAKVEEKAGRLL